MRSCFKKLSNILTVLFVAFFFLGIIAGLGGRMMCIRDNDDYQVKQAELFAPDEITAVLFDEELQQLYVCYNDASYVNVYSADGSFLWAVSTPYLRNVYFELDDNRLIIYNNDDAYIYNSADGAFIEKKDASELDLLYYWQGEYTDKPVAGEYCFDTYRVYRCEADGSLVTIVSRPWWYWCFNFVVCWTVSFVGGVGLGILFFIKLYSDYRKAKKELKNQKPLIKNRKGRFALKYFQATSAVHIVYTVLNLALASLLDGALCIGIMPIAIHFIISSVVFQNMLEKISFTENEEKIVGYQKNVGLYTFVIAFFSVIVASSLAMA